MSFAVGSTIAGKYQIQRVLGQGGMGTVYLARHLLLDRSVAIKVLRNEAAAHPLARERLVREGRALARLRGQHIARVLDVEAKEGGPCFLVLEYLEGEPLGGLLERSGPLPVSEAVGYALEVCEALAEAHREGIVHRDIKPSNLFLTTFEDGARGTKVIDFGISKHDAPREVLTQSGAIVGSPCYMAPEQMRSSGTVDARCDIWALGVVFYEMLVGQPPHAGTNVLEICASILESPPKSPRTVRADVPLGLDVAVRRCMARDPEERFASVTELALAIVQHSGSSADRLGWIVPDDSSPKRADVAKRSSNEMLELSAVGGDTLPERSPVAGRGRKFIRIGVGLIVAVVVGLGIWIGAGERERPDLEASAAHTVAPELFISDHVPVTPSGAVPVNSVGSATTEPAREGPVLQRQNPVPRVVSRPRTSPSEPALAKPASSVQKGETPATAQSAALAPGSGPDPVLQYGRF